MERVLRRCAPEEWVEGASQLLRNVWDPNSAPYSAEYSAAPLDYSPEYLRWQFTHPSDLPPICFVVEEAGRLACFVAAIAHRVLFDANETQAYFSSHFAAARGSHALNAIRVLKAEVGAVAETGSAVFSYAGPGADGEKMMRFGVVNGYEKKRCGLLPGYVALPQASADRAEKVSAETWSAARLDLPVPPLTLDISSHPESLAHYETHPWSREFVVASEGGRPSATAIAGTVQSVTRNGVQTTAVLNAIRVRNAAGLAALISYAAKRFNAPAVSLPVCEHIDRETLRSVRARRIQAEFGWHVSVRPADPLARAEHTILEIV